MPHELPPTAGMPLLLSDLFAAIFKPARKSFESRLAEFLEVGEIDVFSSGTLCLSLAFETVKKITGRSRVIVPAYTCPLLAIAAHAAAVELVLCDTAEGTFEFDIDMLQKICDQSIAALVPTDIAGLPVDISRVNAIARKVGAYVIEDAAQALGARRGGKPVGYDADLAVYSLAVGKGLSLYDGGIISVRDRELRNAVRKTAEQRVKDNFVLVAERIVALLGLTFFYNPCGLEWFYGRELRQWLDRGDLVRAVGEHFALDIPAYKFDDFRKRAGAIAFSRLPDFVSANRARATSRLERLNNTPGLQVLQENSGSEGSWPFFMLLADSESQRDAIMRQLWSSGLGVTRLFIHQLSDYAYLRKIVPQESMPHAKDFAARSFSITNTHWLDEEKFGQILSVMEKASQGCDSGVSFRGL